MSTALLDEPVAPDDDLHARMFFTRPGLAGVRPPNLPVTAFRLAMTLGLYHFDRIPAVFGIPTEGWTFERGLVHCLLSDNFVCKHEDATVTFYADLSFMPDGVTALAVTATTDDPYLQILGVEVVNETIVVDDGGWCGIRELAAGRALRVLLAGGVASCEDVIITLVWLQADGDRDARGARILIVST